MFYFVDVQYKFYMLQWRMEKWTVVQNIVRPGQIYFPVV